MKVSFYDNAEDTALKFAVVLARTQTGWVFCRHRKRTTWEIPGGHREPGESIEQTARRELWEETGASCFVLKPVCVYGVCDDNNRETLGMLYLAHITAFDTLPELEIAEILHTDTLPERWTYPHIQPLLLEEAARRGAF